MKYMIGLLILVLCFSILSAEENSVGPMDKIDRVKLKYILRGVEDYCELLKNASFHSARGSREITLAPVAIFGRVNRDQFDFVLVGFKDTDGVDTAVLEILAAEKVSPGSILGKVWIDLSDHSVMRIIVNPASMESSGEVFSPAIYWSSIPGMEYRIDFYRKQEGIRFPTAVYKHSRRLFSGVRNGILSR